MNWKPYGSVRTSSSSRPPSFKRAPQLYSLEPRGRGVVAPAFLYALIFRKDLSSRQLGEQQGQPASYRRKLFGKVINLTIPLFTPDTPRILGPRLLILAAPLDLQSKTVRTRMTTTKTISKMVARSTSFSPTSTSDEITPPLPRLVNTL